MKLLLGRKYEKSFTRLIRAGKYSLSELEIVVNILLSSESLPKKYKDHQLVGKLKEYRECHVQNDILLIYRVYENEDLLELCDIGTHAQLFG